MKYLCCQNATEYIAKQSGNNNNTHMKYPCLHQAQKQMTKLGKPYDNK
jgi:hypothetical protein